MKSLLKLFGAFALATSPVVAVVACGSEDTNINPEDIQSSALALMRDSEFKMTDLGIANRTDLINLNSQKFKDFVSEIQDKISSILANELKKSTNEHPTQWYYDDTSVVVDNGSVVGDDTFQLPMYVDGTQTFEGIVNGHLSVRVSVTYKNLPPISKDIKLTFNNDVSTNEEKTIAMKDFVNYKIATASDFPTVDVATLPSSGSTDILPVAIQNLNNSIVPHLRLAIKHLIQYQDLAVIITPYYDPSAPVATSFFTIAPPTEINGQLQFNGTLKNIAISFNIGDKSSSFQIANDKIKVTQSQTNAANQVSGAFDSQSLFVTTLAELPKSSDIITSFPNLKNKIIDDAKAKIDNSYQDIQKADITITNESIAKFTIVDKDQTGFFTLNFEVKHIYTTIPFTVDAQNIKIIVSFKAQP